MSYDEEWGDSIAADLGDYSDPLGPERMSLRPHLLRLAFGLVEHDLVPEDRLLALVRRRSTEIPGLGLNLEEWRPMSLQHLATQCHGPIGTVLAGRLRDALGSLVRTPHTPHKTHAPAPEVDCDEVIRICERLYLQYADARLLTHHKEDHSTRTTRANARKAQGARSKPLSAEPRQPPLASTPVEFLNVVPKSVRRMGEAIEAEATLDEFRAAVDLSDVAVVCDLPVFRSGRSLRVATIKGTSRKLEQASALLFALASLSVFVRGHGASDADIELESLHLATTIVGSYLPAPWLATEKNPDPELDAPRMWDRIVEFLKAPPRPRPCKHPTEPGPCWMCAQHLATANRLYAALASAFPSAMKGRKRRGR